MNLIVTRTDLRNTPVSSRQVVGVIARDGHDHTVIADPHAKNFIFCTGWDLNP